jgi:hypothetical protein
MQEALQNLPNNTILCVNETLDLSYRYIAKYNLTGNKNIIITRECDQAGIAKVHYKFELKGDDITGPTTPIDPSVIDKVLFDGEALMVYQAKS